MKKVVAALLALTLCGCGGNGIAREAEVHDTDGRFICDSDSYEFETVVDSHTGVTYLVWKDGFAQASKGGITVLLNRDGTPVISEEVGE